MPQKNQGKIDPRLNVCLDDLVEIKRLDDVPDEDGLVRVSIEFTDPQAVSDLYDAIQGLNVVTEEPEPDTV